jgi:enamine deaminase RidA (YjgF/YER057c/UK114 family)
MERKNVLLGNPYEEIVGFSRAVRVGSFVAVGGTAPIGPDGNTVGIGEIETQTRRCFEIIGEALEAAGAGFGDVIRTRMLLTRIDDFETVTRVRKEYVGVTKPVDTIMQVAGFVNPEWLIEIEVDAMIAPSELPASG